MQDAILRNFRKVVTSKFISENARKTNFNCRVTSKISGVNFIQMLIMQINSGREINYSNLNSTLCRINHHICISNQALSEYFYRECLVQLLPEILPCLYSGLFPVINHFSQDCLSALC